jgi:hypothetical protein
MKWLISAHINVRSAFDPSFPNEWLCFVYRLCRLVPFGDLRLCGTYLWPTLILCIES